MSVEVRQIPGMHIEVLRTYGGTPKLPVLWRGKLLFKLMNDDFMEVEATLLKSKGGDGNYVGWPQRAYEVDGQTKYASQLWMSNKNAAAAATECIERELGIHEEYDPNESGKANSDSMPEPDYPPDTY